MTSQEMEQLKARFFGMHIGCKCRYQFSDKSEHQRTIVGVIGDTVYVENEDPNSKLHCGVNIDKCKLILRPLSSITNEEAIEVFTKATGMYIVEIKRDSEKIVGVGMGRNAGHTIGGGGNVAMWLKTSPFPIGRFLETWNSYQGGENPEYMDFIAVDYLRSLGFCLPFMGLDPVAGGWAVLSPGIFNQAIRS